MPSTSSSVRAEILTYSRTQSTVRRCRSQELDTSSNVIPAHEAFHRTRSVSELCSLFEQASVVHDLYKEPVMEEKKSSRLVGSKVSQIANIFQSMVPAKETDVLISNSTPLRNKPSDSSPKLERRRAATGNEEVLKEPSTPRDSPTQVTVVRTESHVARFNNARALFEKLGAEDGRGIVSSVTKPEKPVTVPAITTGPKLPLSQGLHGLRSRSSSDNSSTGTSPVRSPRTAIGSHHSSRSPSPREQGQSDSVTTGGGSLFGIVSSGTSELDGRKVFTTNGHHTNGGPDLVDEEVAVPSTHVLTTVSASITERLSQPQNVHTTGKVTDSNHSNGVIKTENEKAATEEKSQTAGGVTSLTKKPEKPEKPERKFSSRELIEKQRNWTSHFSKSRSSRYNSDPNKTEVRVSLSAGGAENKTSVVGSQQQTQKLTADSSLPSTNPAARSASFSVTRPVRSPTVSPPPPPVRAGQAASPVSPTRQEKKVESSSEPLTLASPVRDTISASVKDEKLRQQQPKLSPDANEISASTSIGQGSDAGSEGNLAVPSSGDAEKRLREEEAGEVRNDVAHVDKRSKKMVSSVQLHLQAAGLGPTKPVSVASSKDSLPSPEPKINHSAQSESNLSSGNVGDIYPPAPITNSVLRELESQSSDDTSLLPAARYTEITNHECSEKVEESKLLQVLGQGDTFTWRYNKDTVAKSQSDEEASNEELFSKIQKEETVMNLKARSLPTLQHQELVKTAGKEQFDVETEPVLSARTVLHDTCAPQIHVNTKKTSVDVIGGSGYIASHFVSSDEDSDVRVVARPTTDVTDAGNMKDVTGDSCTSVIEQSTEVSRQESEPFLVSRSILRPEEVSTATSLAPISVATRTGSPQHHEVSSEASILDLQDVEYADADAEDGDDEAEHEEERIKAPDEFSQQVPFEIMPTAAHRGKDKEREDDRQQEAPRSLTSDVPETMTPDEAENLLSSSILEKKIRQEGLLSDEEAQEVTRLLSPTDERDQEDPEWLTDVLSVTSDSLIQESTLDYRSRSEMSVTMEDSMTSSHIGSHSGSESGLLGSVSSLNDQDGIGEQEPKGEDYVPQPGKVIIVENGVHYFEDGHFWMEVPGLPESEEEDDVDYPIPVKKNTKVTFSTGPIKVYSTFSVNDYDRRNEDVDPVAASAEYELEKRVEKMQVFPVELTKGPEGLGLSIIGMGVGADAGLEKLGIFVKTITEHGAAARDSRIQVNDQIIEVDGKSLVGVTQAYAASVLRNTCGLVKFLIGREKDPQNSEVAQLIKQSLQADREREEQRRQMEQQQQQPPPRNSSRNLHHGSDGIISPDGTRSEDSSLTLPLTGTSPTTSSSSEGPTSPPGANESVFDHDASKSPSISNDVDALRRLLQESQFKVALADGDISRLKARLVEMEQSGLDSEEFLEKLRQSTMKLREMEHNLLAAKKDVASYQDMLEQSQGQYIALEKKYCKAKKLLREFQQREQDLLHREEFYLQLLQEKDTEYNALVKTLKDRVIQLEQELLETQRKAGFPAVLPYDSSSLRQLTPQLSRRQQALPVKPLLEQLETELSDTEISDISPEDGDKTATVERKMGLVTDDLTAQMPVKEELDRAVPPHELLDVSASKAKAELATRGGLAGRQLPTSKKGSGGLSSSSSDYGLDESCDNSGDEEEQDRQHLYIEYAGREETSTETRTPTLNAQNQQQHQHHQTANRPTSLSPSSSLYNNVTAVSSSMSTSHVHSLVSQFSSTHQQQHYSTSSPHVTSQQTVSKMQHQQHHMHFQTATSPSSLHSPSSATVLPHTTATALYSHVTHMPTSQPLHHYHPHQQTPSTHPHGIAQSHHAVTGVTSQHQPSPDPWIGRNKGPTPTYPIGPPRGLAGPPASLAEQLKQVLAERERRISGDQASSREGSGDFTEMNKGVSQTLAEEIRQAVNEANARVKKVPISSTLSPPSTQTPWQPQSSLLQDMAPPSPSSISSSGSVSPGVHTADPSPSKPVALDSGDVWAPPHPQDLNTSFSAEKKSSHFWQSAPVSEWSKEQVCQWLLALGLEQHIPKFLELQVGGSALLQLESRDFKQLGVNGDDKNRLKRKLKELKVQVEKEKRQQEKERKEKERLQKKAEKLAEKASKRK